MRVAACADPELKKVLAHNRDEEMEHAVMTLEWLRRNMPGWDEQLRTYLFTSGDITMIEDLAEKSGSAPNAAAPGEAAAALGQPRSPGQTEAGSGGLGIGSQLGQYRFEHDHQLAEQVDAQGLRPECARGAHLVDDRRDR